MRRVLAGAAVMVCAGDRFAIRVPTRRAGGRTSRRSPMTAWTGATRAAPATSARPTTSRHSFSGPGSSRPARRGYLQPIAFKTRRIVESQSSLALVRSGQDRAADARRRREHQHARRSVALASTRRWCSPATGCSVPERGIDDLQGLDLQGAVVVYLAAVPAGLPGPLQAHVGSAAERWKALKAAGAIGDDQHSPTRRPWRSRGRGRPSARLQPQMSLADPALDEAAGLQLSVTMNPAHADKLFAGSGHTFAEVLALADGGRPLPRLRAAGADQGRRPRRAGRGGVAECRRHPARIGSDAARRVRRRCRRTWIISASPIRRSTATASTTVRWTTPSGVAAMIEVAARIHEAGTKPARSILFLAVTGEEKGQLGSRYFAAHPTRRRRRAWSPTSTPTCSCRSFRSRR